MKHAILSILAATVCISAGAQQVYLQCDFSNGIPSTFALYDVDGNEPSVDMKNFGFEIGTPWIAITDGKDNNMAACSTSWYRTPGTSDDWMVTPAIQVDSDKAVLRWKGKAADPEYRDGYLIYISTSAATPDEFKLAEPTLTIKAEKEEWTEHEISLDNYVGEAVKIAFVNNTRDKARLLIDDIFIGVPSALEIKSSIPRVWKTLDKFTISGTVTNRSASDIDAFTIKYQLNDSEWHSETINRKVKAGKDASFSFVSEVELEKFQTAIYSLSVESGDDISTVSGKTSCYPRKVVAEEVTGTWCGYCVRGIVAMRDMKENYSDSFIGIAVHNGSPSWPDPMAMPDYTDWLFSKLNMSGYPHATLNRQLSTTGDPINIYNWHNQILEKESWFGIELSATPDEVNNTIEASSNIYVAKDFENYDLRMAYAIVENDVHNDEVDYSDTGRLLPNGYEQNNYYADYALGEMGGFEEMPSTIHGSDMWYQDVARYITDNCEGTPGELPSTLKEDETLFHQAIITLPDNILNAENTELVAMLINGKSGEILNAEILPLKGMFSSISDICIPSPVVRISRSGDSLQIDADCNIDTIQIFGIDGTLLSSSSPGEAIASVSLPQHKGMAIVIVTAGTHKTVKKIIF